MKERLNYILSLFDLDYKKKLTKKYSLWFESVLHQMYITTLAICVWVLVVLFILNLFNMQMNSLLAVAVVFLGVGISGFIAIAVAGLSHNVGVGFLHFIGGILASVIGLVASVFILVSAGALVVTSIIVYALNAGIYTSHHDITELVAVIAISLFLSLFFLEILRAVLCLKKWFLRLYVKYLYVLQEKKKGVVQ